MLLLIQGFKYRLTDVLEVHKDKSCKIHVQRRNRILDQRRVRAENADQRFRDENDHAPHDGRVTENEETHDQNGFPHTSRSAGTVVVAQDRGSSLYHGVDRCLNKLAHTGDDGHDGDIDIAAGDGKDIVITVSDNGLGMTKEQCETILKKDRSDSKGIGVKNVNDRLKIYFGDEYGISIDSELDVGTTVTIRIPKIEKGRENEY